MIVDIKQVYYDLYVKSILVDIRKAVGLTEDNSEFDTDLLIHINSAIGRLNQNGVGKSIPISDDTTTWKDLMDDEQVEGNRYFHMVPSFVMLSTKIIFDPPPPSAVEYYSRNVDETLWRLKIAYDRGEDDERL